jgi:hypothetical protein
MITRDIETMVSVIITHIDSLLVFMIPGGIMITPGVSPGDTILTRGVITRQSIIALIIIIHYTIHGDTMGIMGIMMITTIIEHAIQDILDQPGVPQELPVPQEQDWDRLQQVRPVFELITQERQIEPTVPGLPAGRGYKDHRLLNRIDRLTEVATGVVDRLATQKDDPQVVIAEGAPGNPEVIVWN